MVLYSNVGHHGTQGDQCFLRWYPPSPVLNVIGCLSLCGPVMD